jgi:hypothetical protein
VQLPNRIRWILWDVVVAVLTGVQPPVYSTAQRQSDRRRVAVRQVAPHRRTKTSVR